ncbi:bone morphogenetic protein 5-like [Diorhabda sublineata]|uniref:bone morphogenetic protein 5-like n=1 Tax=Diorhabda sublineata TaxID=1163346 RepID=UPI0024E0CD8D|nr:bone morphogenetic protein 5-like [Diorhabda sublineata]
MGKFFLLMFVVEVVLSQNSNNSGKSYFFKMGRNNNEFKVNNRIMYLNHNITDLEYPLLERKKSYHTSQNSDKAQQAPKFDFSYYLDKEWEYVHESNPINKSRLPSFLRIFYDEATSHPDTSITRRILFNKNLNASTPILKFNLDNIDPELNVIDADLYFYWPLKDTSNIFKESVVIRLYQYEKQSYDDTGNSSINNPDIHKLFNVIYVSKAQKGWQMFKVKKPIDNWLNGEENLGLILTISSYDTNKLIEVFHDKNMGNFSTFIVVKTQSNGSSSVLDDNEITDYDTNSQCQIQEWVINFQKMGWDKFIIFPEQFSAFDCVGKCSTPDKNDTNHAKFLYIFQKRSACCVPVWYKSLPIMYFDKFRDIAIKNYDKTIITKCGCR